MRCKDSLKRLRNKLISAILDWNVLDTVVLLKVVYYLVCLFFNSKLTNNFNDDPYHSLHICHLVSSLANVSAIIVLCCVLNR